MPEKSLDQIPLTYLKGIGPSLEKKFAQLQIFNLRDLLFHLPHRYEDRTKIHSIDKIKVGEHVLLQGKILSNSIQFGRRRSLVCSITDNTGVISLRFFHFSGGQKTALASEKYVQCYGEVRRGRSGFEIYHPEYKIVDSPGAPLTEDSLTPIYPTTEGMQQSRLRYFINQALEISDSSEDIQDLLPLEIASKFNLCGLTTALQIVHHPPCDSPLHWTSDKFNSGQKRLAFEELLAHQLCMRKSRSNLQEKIAPALRSNNRLINLFLKHLPFKLTAGQQLAFQEISADLNSKVPMLRLLQGDVGSGKTVISALASLHAIDSGFQVGFMAPTEILAEQHFESFMQWFSHLGINVGWLSGKLKGASRSQQLKTLASGDCQMIIGTHALFQDDVEYKSLGLIIIDEQHRFGVHQRLTLKDKARNTALSPHQLIMTATPIPRTLAMSAYADLDSSVIKELPLGRLPIDTAIVSNHRRGEVVKSIRKACAGGNQAYWVCTLIEESEALSIEAAEVTAEQLGKLLPDISIGLVHGRMKPEEKKSVMTNFREKLIQVLVATTVIEVGVDIPNANLMIIENPERLGLAQLHQLRGRVGRSDIQSYCILLYQPPLSTAAKERLSVMRDSADGFYIAEKDLELRGAGQILGTQQTGLMSFKIAEIGRDAYLLDEVKESSELIFEHYPEVAESLIHRWLGERKNYASV